MKNLMCSWCPLFVSLFFIQSSTALAQPQHEHGKPDHAKGQHEATPPDDHSPMKGMYGSYPMSREASGTSWQPDATPHAGLHWMKGEWMGMTHGFVNGIYSHQEGPRGDEEVFSTSMLMLMAQREVAGGTLGLRGMWSLDPLMGKEGYPLLLQTGETADGISPLIDRQHPHDFLMEMAATYSRPITADSSVFVYAGLPGEPALGPPAFMHRFSGMNIQEAPLSHHWLDSTHITFGVLTGGYVRRNWKVEASAFRGREPDEDRWDVETPELDSYAARLSFNPNERWSFQVSGGALDSPEQLHPTTDTDRFTASAAYHQTVDIGDWQTMLAWGRNDLEPGETLDAFLLESALEVNKAHTFLSRIEWLEKNELFLEGHPLEHGVFDVSKLSVGYIYDFLERRSVQVGIGGLAGMNFLPDELEEVYGRKHPMSYVGFLRLKM